MKGVVPGSPTGHEARDSPEADAQTLDDVEREVDRGAMCDRSGSSRNTLAKLVHRAQPSSVAVGTLTPLWGAAGDGRRMGAA